MFSHARWSRRWSPAVAVCALIVLSAGVETELSQRPADKQTQPTFRARVDLVEIDFVATDASGRPVLDLQKDELQVLEEGKPRDVASLALVNLPLPEPHAPYAHDVASNDATDDSRLFFLILDDVHTLRERTDSVKAVARRFVERLSPGDQLAVAWVSLGNAGAREFTANHAEVLAAIDRFSAADTRVARRNPNDSSLPEHRDPDDLPPRAASRVAELNVKGVFDRSRPFQMVIDVATYLTSLPHRRKAIVFVGTGPRGMQVFDDPRSDAPLKRDALDFTRAVTAARRANVAVYLLDPSKELRDDVPVRPRAIPPEAANANPFDRRAIQDLVAAGHGNGISMLSIATGGFDDAGPGVLSAVDNVVSETGTYYLLGYYADPPTGGTIQKVKSLFDPSSGFRSIEVKTTRPGVVIRARKGYWGSDAGAIAEKPASKNADETAASVAGVLPRTALALRAFAAPLHRGTSSKPEVAIVVEATLPPMAPAALGLPLSDDVEMLVAAVAPGQGVRATDRARVRLNVGGAAGGGLISPRFRLCSVVAVTPGRYQLRVGVQSGLAGKAGSVYADVTVPDFARDPLSLGGVFLERRPTGPPVPTVRTRTFAALVPFETTLDRDFASADDIWVRVRAYGGKGTAGQILLRALVTRPQDGTTVWTAEKRESAGALRDEDGVEYVVQLPMSALSPGAYRLRVTVEGQGAKAHAREIDFSVHAGSPPVAAGCASGVATAPDRR